VPPAGHDLRGAIKVIVRLVVWDMNEETGFAVRRDVKEKEVFSERSAS